MKLLKSRVLWGALLIVAGLGLLLQNLGVFSGGGFFWALVLAVGGGVFLSMYYENRANWWALIPSISLFGIALGIFLGAISSTVGGLISGFFILGGIGLSFVILYWVKRDFWWAVIPAGVLSTLALVSVLDELNLDLDTGGIFLIGLGLTFLVVAWLPGLAGKMKWAYIPAVILIVIGGFITAASQAILSIFWAVLLVVAGLVLMLRPFLLRR